MKKIILTAAALAAIAVAGCTQAPSPQITEQQRQTAELRLLNQSQPVPQFSYSQERQALIAAETIAAEGTQTTSFFFNQGVTDPIFTCPSIGLGVPDSAQLSNPQQIVGVPSTIGGGSAIIAQEDPFGVYTPSSSTGTYVICVNGQGQEYLVRWEGFVETVSGPAVWDVKTHSEHLIGPPSVIIHTRKP